MKNSVIENYDRSDINPQALNNLRKAVQKDIDDERMYGAAMIVAKGGQIVMKETFGTVAENRPAKIDDLYLAMSLSKSFSAMLALNAVDKGLLSLNTRVAELFPEFETEDKVKITLFHLLTHQAGLYDSLIPPAPYTPNDVHDLDKMFQAYSKEPIKFATGEKSSYSPLGSFAVVGKMLEKVDPAGRKFNQIAQEELFKPLGMSSTRFGNATEDPRRVLVSHTPKMQEGFSTLANPEVVRNYLNGFSAENSSIPGGNAFTTVEDLFLFTETLRLGGTASNGYRLVSPALLKYATKNHCGNMPNEILKEVCIQQHLTQIPANFGLHGGYVRGEGIFLSGAGQTASPSSYYAVGGASTMFMIDPERELTTIFLSAGFIEGIDHFIRLSKLNDLAISACE